MRDAGEVVYDLVAAIDTRIDTAECAAIIEADRRDAKLEVLRELDARCNRVGSTHSWPDAIEEMIGELTPGAEK